MVTQEGLYRRVKATFRETTTQWTGQASRTARRLGWYSVLAFRSGNLDQAVELAVAAREEENQARGPRDSLPTWNGLVLAMRLAVEQHKVIDAGLPVFPRYGDDRERQCITCRGIVPQGHIYCIHCAPFAVTLKRAILNDLITVEEPDGTTSNLYMAGIVDGSNRTALYYKSTRAGYDTPVFFYRGADRKKKTMRYKEAQEVFNRHALQLTEIGHRAIGFNRPVGPEWQPLQKARRCRWLAKRSPSIRLNRSHQWSGEKKGTTT